MKKLLTILLALSLTAVAAVSCGNTTEEDPKPGAEVEAPADDIVNTPADDIVNTPADDVVDTPADDVVDTPADDVVDTPADDVVDAPADDVIDAPADDVVDAPIAGEDAPVEDEAPVEGEEAPAEADFSTAAGVIDLIYEIKAPEFMYGTFPDEIVLADEGSFKYYTGLDSQDGIKDVAVSESMMGSQAYSLVVVKVEDASNAKATAEAMKNGIDQRKWMCVEADDIIVSGYGDTVMLIMIDSEYRESISVTDITEAFKSVCGGTLDFEI